MMGRVPALDGLRGIAILLVLFFHFTLFGRLGHWAGRATGVDATASAFIARVADIGWIGVDLFFVLSGTLITRGLLEDGGRHGYLRRFYARRMLRIFPLYYAVIAIFVAVFVWRDAPLGSLLAPATYTANWVMGITGTQSVPAELNHSWSLAIEEQFYLLFPLFFLFLRARGIATVAFVGFVGALVTRILVRPELPLASFLTPARMDGLLAGALVAVAFHHADLLAITNDRRFRIARSAVAGATLIFVAFVLWRRGFSSNDIVVDIYGRSLLVVLFAAVIAYVLATPDHGATRVLASPALRMFGRYSYGMYMLHPPLVALAFALHVGVRRFATATGSLLVGYLAFAGVMLAATMLAAMASYHGFESRFLRLQQRYRPADTGAAKAQLSCAE